MNQRFEDYIKDCNSNFSELSKYASDIGIVEKYYSATKGNYRKFFNEKESLKIEKFAVRHYRAKKEMYCSAQMFVEATRSMGVGCIISHFFLCYYSLFHAMQSVLFLNPNLDSDKVLDLSHNEVKKYFEDFYCKGNKSIMPPEIIDAFVLLKEYRELYSYTMPFNNPRSVNVELDRLKYYLSLCFQLVSLNSFIIYQTKHPAIRIIEHVSLKEYFKECCCKKDPLTDEWMEDEADEFYWMQMKKWGIDFWPYVLDIEHDMDEYGGYDSRMLEELGFKEHDAIKMGAFRLVYELIC